MADGDSDPDAVADVHTASHRDVYAGPGLYTLVLADTNTNMDNNTDALFLFYPDGGCPYPDCGSSRVTHAHRVSDIHDHVSLHRPAAAVPDAGLVADPHAPDTAGDTGND
jgi:hypothetical protein